MCDIFTLAVSECLGLVGRLGLEPSECCHDAFTARSASAYGITPLRAAISICIVHRLAPLFRIELKI